MSELSSLPPKLTIADCHQLVGSARWKGKQQVISVGSSRALDEVWHSMCMLADRRFALEVHLANVGDRVVDEGFTGDTD